MLVLKESMQLQSRPSRREWILAALYALILVYLNAYICRDLVRNPTAFMASMHGFWIALAKRAEISWFRPTWWPYWDAGIPFEFTYAPLVPALTAAGAALSGVSHVMAFQSVTALVYCLGPLTLFVMAWMLTRSPGASFLAALMYSLTASTQLIVPDERFDLYSGRVGRYAACARARPIAFGDLVPGALAREAPMAVLHPDRRDDRVDGVRQRVRSHRNGNGGVVRAVCASACRLAAQPGANGCYGSRRIRHCISLSSTIDVRFD